MLFIFAMKKKIIKKKLSTIIVLYTLKFELRNILLGAELLKDFNFKNNTTTKKNGNYRISNEIIDNYRVSNIKLSITIEYQIIDKY